MQIEKKLIQVPRRNFLGRVALAGSGAVLAPQLAQAAVAEGPSISAEPAISQGYNKTPHVQAYYKRARF